MINAKRSAQRIQGRKLIRKHALATLGEQLYAAFLRELKDARTWEVKSEMPKALGVINFTAATGEIEKIVARNLPQEAVTDSAACALAMLRRSHKNDASEIIKLLKTVSYSALIGAVTALTVDQMVPCEAEILEILKLTKDANKHKDRQGPEFGRRVRGPT